MNNTSRLKNKWHCIIIMLSLFLTIGIQAKAASESKRKLNGIGNVVGIVIDAKTDQPLEGASISYIEPPDCEKLKDDSASSASDGSYQISAPLGEIKSRFVTEHVLDMSIASLLSGAGMHKEKFVNVSRLWLMVSKEGYKTFTGPVDVFKAMPGAFQVCMNPIALASASSKYGSFIHPYNPGAYVNRFMPNSYVYSQGDEVNVSITSPLVPAATNKRGICEVAFFLGNYIAFPGVSFKYDFDYVKPNDKLGPVIYNRVYGTKKDIRPAIYKASITLMDGGNPGTSNILDQGQHGYVALGVSEQKKNDTANLVRELNEANALGRDQRVDSQIAILDKLILLQPFEADVSTLYELKTEILIPYNAKDANEAYSHVNPKDHSDYCDAILKDAMKVTNGVYGYEIVNTQFHPDNIDLRRTILTKILDLNKIPEKTLKPQIALNRAKLFASWHDYEKAISMLKTLISDQKIGKSAQIQLANIYYTKGEFDSAYSIYQQMFPISDLKDLKEFRAAHNYGVLLFRDSQINEAAKVFALALTFARNKPTEYESPSGYVSAGNKIYTVLTGPSLSAVAGYSYPEAASDLLILDNLDAYGHEVDLVSQAVMLGRALGEIGLIDQGVTVLKRVLEVDSTDENALAALAVTQAFGGRIVEAKKTCKSLLSINPKNFDGVNLSTLLSNASVRDK